MIKRGNQLFVHLTVDVRSAWVGVHDRHEWSPGLSLFWVECTQHPLQTKRSNFLPRTFSAHHELESIIVIVIKRSKACRNCEHVVGRDMIMCLQTTCLVTAAFCCRAVCVYLCSTLHMLIIDAWSARD